MSLKDYSDEKTLEKNSYSIEDTINESLLALSETKAKRLEQVWKSLAGIGLNNDYVLNRLNHLIFNAVTHIATQDWDEYFADYNTQLKAIKTWRKLKWYGKWKITMEDLFWLNSDTERTKLIFLMDKLWLDNNAVFAHLKKIMDNAVKPMFVKASKDEEWYIALVTDEATRLAAVQEWSILKEYLDDESMNILKFFKVDNDRKKTVLSIKC